MLRDNYGTAADYFAIGIVTHELMMRVRPWKGDTRREYKVNLLHNYACLIKNDTPEDWNHEASDFINKLIKRRTE